MTAAVTKLRHALRVCNFGSKPVKYQEASDLQAKLADYCRSESSLDTVLQLQVRSQCHRSIALFLVSTGVSQ